MPGLFTSLGRLLADRLDATLARRRAASPTLKPPTRKHPTPKPAGRQRTPTSPSTDGADEAYPGDFTGRPEIIYAPLPGNLPDPGEVVWGWVPYEEDHSRGKDRPVLVIGRDDPWLLGLPLTSVDHDRDAAQEASEGRFWIDVGTGPWDAKQRPSEARVDRIVRLDPSAVRRVGGTLDEERFRAVAQAVRLH
ncbi:MAG TPA: type II toxin-antitoxin system PemK/MazF family toxin [Propionibacteriaceae bacterium]|nr:type II toxin-antitoxin system PemK/MazF family toxin [Propionibacteriaceae bacterium]